MTEVKSRHFSECHQRACHVLDKQQKSKDYKLTFEDVLFVLEALPQSKNTRRIGVIPTGESFVFSQAAGLTTQHGAKPTLSNLCLKCPQVIRVLSRFVLDYDPSYTFTTITINYNYAANKHRDINHENGHARIIALGNFTGGGLSIETIDDDIDIKNQWFDFDGTLEHSTNPFKGERYSLVYFTHIAYCSEAAIPLLMKLMSLGLPCPPSPITILSSSTAIVEKIQPVETTITSDKFDQYNHQTGSNKSSRNLSLTNNSIHDDLVDDTINHTDREDVEDVFYFVPDILSPQYSSFVTAEAESLIYLYFGSWYQLKHHCDHHKNVCSSVVQPLSPSSSSIFPSCCKVVPPTLYNTIANTAAAANHTIDSKQTIGPSKSLSSSSTSSHSKSATYENNIRELAQRAISFKLYKKLCDSNTLEALKYQLQLSSYRHMPANFNLDLFSYGRKLSTRQRRRIVMSASLGLSQQLPGVHYFKLCLLLDYDESRCDEQAVRGVLRKVSLCVLVDQYWNEYLKPVHVECTSTLPSSTVKSAESMSTSLSVSDNMVNSNNTSTTEFDRNSVNIINGVCSVKDTDEANTYNNITTSTVTNKKHQPSISSTVVAATPLRPALSKLICDLARITTGSLVLDPFCGSGSLLLAAENVGAICFGSDIHLSHIESSHQIQPSKLANNDGTALNIARFTTEYFSANIYHNSMHTPSDSDSDSDSLSSIKMSSPDVDVANGSIGNSSTIMPATTYTEGIFDAIICDPPYGRREKHVDIRGVDCARHETPEQRAQERFQVLQPLMKLASHQLRRGGRMVFLFVNYLPTITSATVTTKKVQASKDISNMNSDNIIEDSNNSVSECSSNSTRNSGSNINNNMWTASDLPIPIDGSLKVCHICRESWTYATGHTLARDTVVIEKL